MSGQVNLSVCLVELPGTHPWGTGAPGSGRVPGTPPGSDPGQVPGTSENHWRRQDSTQKLKMTSGEDFLCQDSRSARR